MLDLETGDWDGLEGLGEEALNELRPFAEIALERAAKHLVEETQRYLGPESGARSGLPYKVNKRGPLHIASAPGEAPAVLWGNLRRSIAHSPIEWSGWEVAAWIGSALEYARILEYGGVAGNGAVIEPRPYLEPTIQRETPRIEQILAEEFGV